MFLGVAFSVVVVVVASRSISRQGPASLDSRYEIRRQFAPYVGVSWERKLGETASLARSMGDEVEETALLAGVRIWF